MGKTLLPMTDRRLGRQLRRVARTKYDLGEMNLEDRDRIIAGSRDGDTLVKWREALVAEGAPWSGRDDLLTGFDWPTIWSWLLANWPTILKVLLTILLLGDSNADPGPFETYYEDEGEVLL